MLYKCCVPACRGNYVDGPKVRVFSFPKDETLRKKWISAIPRKGFTPSKSSKVCEQHFLKEQFITEVSEQDSRTGQIVTIKLMYPRLQSDAIPTKFPGCPEYYSKPLTIRKSRDAKLRAIDETRFVQALQESEKEYLCLQNSISYKNYEEFLNILNTLPIPEGWYNIHDKNKATLFKLTYTPGPAITYAVVINSDLTVNTYLYGRKMSISINKLKAPFKTCNLNEIRDLLEVIDTGEMEKFDNSNSRDSKQEGNDGSVKCILNHVSNILENLIVDEDDSLKFIIEQLKLRSVPNVRYRYSSSTMILSSIIFSISPHAYKFLRHYGSLILPHPETIKNVCSKFLTDPTHEERQSFLTYASNIFKLLDENDKYVMLLMDEIHIQPYLDYKGGNIVGTACNNTSLATAAYVFMITSIKSNFKEVIHISPTSTIKHDILHNFIETIIINLEKIGFRVFCVISDNNALNGKAMSNFSQNKKLSIVYPHPVDKSRPLFFLYDSVHLLKCIFCNWLNSKPDQNLTYPDFKTGEKKWPCLKR